MIVVSDVRYMSYRVEPRASKGPSLVEVAYRTAHASRRCSDVQRLIEEASNSPTRSPTVSVAASALGSDPWEHGGLHLDWQDANPEFTDAFEIRCVFGEALHSLRSALDSLVYNIAWLDSDSRNDWTQFPLTRTRAKWGESVRGKQLKGVNNSHRNWIEEVQPWADCAWAADLAHYSNHDKHRYLLEVSPVLEFRADLHASKIDPQDTTRRILHVDDIRYLTLVEDRDGQLNEDLITVLDRLQVGVATLVNRFLLEQNIPPLKIQ